MLGKRLQEVRKQAMFVNGLGRLFLFISGLFGFSHVYKVSLPCMDKLTQLKNLLLFSVVEDVV